MGEFIDPKKRKPMKGKLIVPGDNGKGSWKKVTDGKNTISLALTRSIKKYLPWKKFKL
jgi:hypothetical protein